MFEFDDSTILSDNDFEMPLQINDTSTEKRTNGAKGMDIGYARVSTDDQRLDLQIDALVKAGIAEDRIYKEYVSGAKTNRPQLNECLRALRPGDVLVVWRLDRLGRSLPELIKVLAAIQDKGIGFRSLNESIDTTTAVGRMVFHMMGAIAQFERDIISERTKAGLKAARARGHRGGRKAKVDDKMLKAAKIMLADPTVTYDDVAKVLKVGRSAIYRALQREKEFLKMQELRKVEKQRKRLETAGRE